MVDVFSCQLILLLLSVVRDELDLLSQGDDEGHSARKHEVLSERWCRGTHGIGTVTKTTSCL